MRVPVSQRLKEYMEINNLKQADIIAKCRPYSRKTGTDIYKSLLSQYVSGSREPSSEKLVILAKALNVSDAWLAGYDVPMERSSEAVIADQASALGEAARDPELIEMLQKIQQLDAPDRKKLSGYLDALYDLSQSDKASEED